MWQGKSQHAMDEYHRRPSRLYQGQVPARWGGTERTQQTEWDTGDPDPRILEGQTTDESEECVHVLRVEGWRGSISKAGG